MPDSNPLAPACRRLIAAAAALMLFAAVAAPAHAGDYPPPAELTGDEWVHDPTMVIRPSGEPYAVLSTNDMTVTSSDLKAFASQGRPLTAVPSWWWTYNPEGHSWAPDVSFHGGRYWMYYSVSTFGSQTSAIGLATSTTAEPGSWTDHGIVFTSSPGKSYNAIDPNLLVDAGGRWWLTFGSHWNGIYQLELNPRTGMPRSSKPKLFHLARYVTSDGTPIENASVVRRGASYYLFASYERCCQWASSTYNIRVGRSTSPNGPFVDASGRKLVDGGGTMVRETDGDVIGPGGQTVVRDEARGRDLLVFHFYDGALGGVNRLGLNVLAWDAAGWPYVSAEPVAAAEPVASAAGA